jgi:biotin transport system substrate-specific component
MAGFTDILPVCLKQISNQQNHGGSRQDITAHKVSGELRMTTLAPTLSLRYFPRAATWLRDAFLVVFGALLVAGLAQVRIPLPFTPVPITGQTFGVLLVGAALGSRRGAASLGLYLTLGLIGFPFFTGGGYGGSYLFGATGGYLIGFIAAAYITGLLAERGLERKSSTSFIPFLIGALVIYACGVTWLAVMVGSLGKALALGFFPFLIGDAIKLAAAALALPAAWKLIK